MMKTYSISIGKPGQDTINEDNAIARDNLIAVSDGAGGGGVYAECWSSYLLEKLPVIPITSFVELDEWIDTIWEDFYSAAEDWARKSGGMVLKKFYEEGAFATLVAAWREEDVCRWISYGDSVVFHYNLETDLLEHSFTNLVDFNRPPYLINCKDSLNQAGFQSGEFNLEENSIVFCATDALAHFILMTYEIEHRLKYEDELKTALEFGSKDSVYINSGLTVPLDFRKGVIGKLINCRSNKCNFGRFIQSLLRKRYIALDDYSYSLMYK